MKLWRKILLGLGIIWLVFAIILVISINLKGECYADISENMNPADIPSDICEFGWMESILAIIFLGIPSWILFLIVGLTKKTEIKEAEEEEEEV